VHPDGTAARRHGGWCEVTLSTASDVLGAAGLVDSDWDNAERWKTEVEDSVGYAWLRQGMAEINIYGGVN
jgi:hypothetical protein